VSRVLVTGGFGFLGSWVADHFADLGHDVSILTRTPHPEHGAWNDRFRVFVGDISSEEHPREAYEGVDLVVHAAAMNAQEAAAHERAAILVNGFGTRNALMAAREAGVRRFICMSSIHVYGALEGGRIDETTPPRTVSDYAISKLLGEGYCYREARRGDIEVFVLRPANGFGVPRFPSADCWMLVVPDFCRRAVEEGRIVLTSPGTQERDFLTLSDIVRAIQLLAEAPAPGRDAGDIIFNVGGGNSIPVRRLAEMVAEIYAEEFGSSVPIELPEGSDDALPGRPMKYGFERIAALGYRPEGDLRAEMRGIMRMLRGR
jgi:UDP-glucose 4-epimerase